ncbi:hypothetical protein AB0L40_24450 [Patulibacter sp. NPDC049589]|uniref:hypothetical protein n=1 Tax=Patulibacter sp. NPDC049589 TaxID=3154731 RepID=UPI00343A9000
MADKKEYDETVRLVKLEGVASNGLMGVSIPGEDGDGGAALIVFESREATKRAFSRIVDGSSPTAVPAVVSRANVVVLSNLLAAADSTRHEAIARVRRHFDDAVFEPCMGGPSTLASLVNTPGDVGTVTDPSQFTYTDNVGNTVPAAP